MEGGSEIGEPRGLKLHVGYRIMNEGKSNTSHAKSAVTLPLLSLSN